MLILKSMKWDNCFSYGNDNYIRFDENPLTQLVGPNGAGKTSISLMLQEVLYGKNNKNIKKQDIANNKSGQKGYSIELNFDKDGVSYRIILDRKSNLKLKLFKNEQDISSHTSLNTYKTIGEIIGVADFKVFCQLIYQHSTDSLDFLTATDTNRKKFLISLLQLEKYIEYHELFKGKVREVGQEVNSIEGSVSTIQAWINKHENMDFLKKDLLEVPEYREDWIARARELESNISNINSINRKIDTNNQYKKELDNLDSKYYMGSAPSSPQPSFDELRVQMRLLKHEQDNHQAKIDKLNKISGECPTCLQEVNVDIHTVMLNQETYKRDIISNNIIEIQKQMAEAMEIEAEIAKYKKEKDQFEKLNQLIDSSLDNQTLDLNEMKEELTKVRTQISDLQGTIKSIETKNREISAHNSKVDVVKNQLKEMKKELHEKNVELVENENLQDILELLKKTFGTNGLVSYKIESSVKELEKKINYYLADLTYFQIYFKLAGEKLNIEVLDDVGNITSISNLSSGERARVNLATLLGVRNILSSLTSTKINLLFLDEITGSLDAEGKEKFTEILLKEKLNTFFVSHEWTHPLVPQINIIKEHHISRIDNE